ncbi:MAG: type II toxin-antitoxin system prevent-host-death family antitoxin [Propionibacteriaceae bacterium]|nr:type II toxin-antitoxin system prevent-host-death family antitoxin [Propionibacteriaceae bacterium]
MTVANVQDAKAHLSALIAEAEAGGEVWIARSGQPVVRLVPKPRPEIQFGAFSSALSQAEAAESMAPLDDAEIELWQ